MKIIKKGKLPEERTKTCTCTKCGTEFIASKAEFHFVPDRDGDFWQIECPLQGCGETYYVDQWSKE